MIQSVTWLRLILSLVAIIGLSGCDRSKTEAKKPEVTKPETAKATTENTVVAPADDAASAGQHVAKNEETEPAFYTVAHYDLKADPALQLQATLDRARTEHKTVLLQVGGDWCSWCKLMSKYIVETESVKNLLDKHYLIQKVTYDPENKNEEFLSQYPKISGYPHIFVLSSDGQLLHSQNTEELEADHGYNETAFVEFLNKWKPAAGK